MKKVEQSETTNNRSKLFLDDYRDPPDDTWMVVRNSAEFEDFLLSEEEPPLHVAFDHDLADNHYYGDFSREKTGYDCAKFLIELCYHRKWKLPEFSCHSMNPVGRQNILNVLNANKQALGD